MTPTAPGPQAHDHPHHDAPPAERPEQAGGVQGWLASVFRSHSHDAAESVDSALESSADGIRVLKIGLVALLVPALAQAVVVAYTRSVALLADSIHSFSDALTVVPLWIAFRWVGVPPTAATSTGTAALMTWPGCSSSP